MRILLITILLQLVFPEGIHRGCMKPENSRSYGSRPVLPETYTSLSGHFLIHYDSPGNEDAPIQESLDNDDIPDYVQEVGLIADLTRQTLVETMGVREEIPDEDG